MTETPPEITHTDTCGCESCVRVRLLSASPTRPMDPEMLRRLVEASRADT